MYYIAITNKGEQNYVLKGNLIYETQSKFQKIAVFETRLQGKMLLLDNVIQFAERDEKYYHEPLIHVPLSFIQRPKKALILGGGDLLAAREILKWKSIKEITLVEIDEEVIKTVKRFFTHLVKKVVNDKRLKIRIMDANKFIEERKDKFDLVVMDLTDPGTEISDILYSAKSFKRYSKLLKKDGVFVTHAESFLYTNEVGIEIYRNMKKAFKYVLGYSHFVPSFFDYWAFAMGSNGINFKRRIETAKKKIKRMEKNLAVINSKFFSFYLPNEVERKMEKGKINKEGITIGKLVEEKDLQDIFKA